jgi:polysaccharide biosynthesis/export protein
VTFEAKLTHRAFGLVGLLLACLLPSGTPAENTIALSGIRDVVAGEAALADRYSSSSYAPVEATPQAGIRDSVYYPGPGDVLTIFVNGGIQTSLPVSISADRRLIIPGVGEVSIDGRTLAELRREVVQRCEEVYHNADIAVVLTHVRFFAVHVTGDVEKPGSYTASAAMRVSDVLEKTGDSESLRHRRNIHMLRDGELEGTVDLAAFYNSGIAEANPFLNDNVQIHVPKRGHTVAVSGAVYWAGTYDYTPGDRLSTILSAAGGAREGVDSGRVIVARFTGDQSAIDTLILSLRTSPDFRLKGDDRITLLRTPDYHEANNVWVQGEVRYPGTYPIIRDSSRLSDIIACAGGLTDRAFPRASYVLRRRDALAPDQSEGDVEEMLEIQQALRIDPATIWPEEMGYQKAMLSGDDRIAIDVGEAIVSPGSDDDIVLRDGDRIVVRSRPGAIQVWGAVAVPGFHTYREGYRVSDYIREAGGYSRIADERNTRIRRCGSSSWMDADNAEVFEGDVILVPEKKYRDRFESVRDFVSFTASTIGIISLALTVMTSIQSLR